MNGVWALDSESPGFEPQLQNLAALGLPESSTRRLSHCFLTHLLTMMISSSWDCAEFRTRWCVSSRAPWLAQSGWSHSFIYAIGGFYDLTRPCYIYNVHRVQKQNKRVRGRHTLEGGTDRPLVNHTSFRFHYLASSSNPLHTQHPEQTSKLNSGHSTAKHSPAAPHPFQEKS